MRALWLVLSISLFSTAAPAAAPPLDPHWDPGAVDCAQARHPQLETYRYDARTWILREDLCSTWEAPFIYLLVGDREALLIDTGDVADPKLMPLAATALSLLPQHDGKHLPLLVVHSHTHLDHRAGDPQFQGLADVKVVPAQLPSVKSFFGLPDWPAGTAQLDLGGRVLDVLPAPGHNVAHVVFYDRETSLLFSGDFLLPARLIVDDIAAYRASARRVMEFLRDRPVSYVLGGHIEEDRTGRLYDWMSSYHPDEHALQLGKDAVLDLPAALDGFNGFQSERDGFVIIDSMHELEAMGTAVLVCLAALGYGVYRWIRRIKRRRAST
ncbi:MAG TPA: MBL fold metallo-hydrolase [Gammaproteobacteria bacterium]|jgi:glyoxylase-like metal-dependent hydrolase (beta-lactamase superfamily II)